MAPGKNYSSGRRGPEEKGEALEERLNSTLLSSTRPHTHSSKSGSHKGGNGKKAKTQPGVQEGLPEREGSAEALALLAQPKTKSNKERESHRNKTLKDFFFLKKANNTVGIELLPDHIFFGGGGIQECVAGGIELPLEASKQRRLSLGKVQEMARHHVTDQFQSVPALQTQLFTQLRITAEAENMPLHIHS